MAQIRSVSTYARAPSNIALVKYMGKSDPLTNLPANPSLSLTLDSLCTVVEVSRTPAKDGNHSFSWVAQVPRDIADKLPSWESISFSVPLLSDEDRKRAEQQMERVVREIGDIFAKFDIDVFDDPVQLECRSANTFPAGAGIASSASSFAAITTATAFAMAREPESFLRTWQQNDELRLEIAALSRKGSGSSCRSFLGPWTLWEGGKIESLRSNLPELTDLVVVVSRKQKQVSSSLAHQLIKASPVWNQRMERVEDRIRRVKTALLECDLRTIAEISWTEAWELHSLFHTSNPPFTYWESGTIEILKWLMPFFSNPRVKGELPIVTLDAGPNVHLIVPTETVDEWRDKIRDRFSELGLLEDRQGRGVTPLNWYSIG